MKVPSGFSLSALHCGIKKKKLDLGLIKSCGYADAVGFFTINANPSYSVTFSKRNINKPIKAVLVNSGNANCFSSKAGLKDTEKITVKLAKELGVGKSNILFASTGIIGKRLPVKKITDQFTALKSTKGTIADFAKSICTTDTFNKVAYRKFSVGKKEVNILGFAKGAGMVAPNMATMLAFIITDAKLPKGALKQLSKKAIEESFNSITVDGCMSTNDTVFMLSSKKVALAKKKDKSNFQKNLDAVCLDLAKMIVKDAEGATKFIEINVKGAKTPLEAKKAGLFIANSNLFKTAVYGQNPNWGRIIAALGDAGIKVSENIGIKVSSLKRKGIKLDLDLKRGKGNWRVYTCDLTPKYIKINAEYS